jgi:SAM-dependent methyltransferase
MLCGSTEFRVWLTGCPDYYLQKGGPVDYVECVACSLVQQCPLPDDVSALYEDYPIHSSRSAFQRLARRIFQRQVYFRPVAGSECRTLLDYGCGDGTFLREIQNRFSAVCGFEPGGTHANALSEQLNAPVYSSTEKMRTERAGKLDIITAHYVLEHVADLRGAFETFQTLLHPGGTLYIAVPNIRSWESCLFKKRWHGLDAPRHLVFPEAVHFKKLAEEYGFGVPQFSVAAFPNTLAASLATVLSGRCQPVLLMGLIVPSWLVALAAPQGTLIIRMVRKD